MDPNQTPQTNQPQVFGSPPQPNQPENPPKPELSSGNNQPSGNKKPLLLGVIGIVAVLIIVTVIAVLLAGSNTPTVVEDKTPEVQNPQPASTIGIEQINNSISQDLSAIDDARDFPETQLADEALGL